MEKIKIAYFHHVTDISGGEIMLVELLRNLNKEIFEPIVILPDRGELYQRIRELGIETIAINFRPLRKKNPLPFFQTIIELYRIIKMETKVDIISPDTYNLNRYTVIVSKLAGIPCICHVNLVVQAREVISNFLLKWVDIIIPASRAVANSLVNYGIPESKIHTIHPSIDVAKFRREPDIGKSLRREFSIKDSDYLVGIVGMIHPQKGHHILIDAIDRVNKLINKEVYLLIVGYDDGSQSHWTNKEYIKYLKEKIKEKKAEDQIFFAGFRKNMSIVYNALDLLVVPSICEDACPIVQLEAMATETPVIATNVGGIPEVNEHNKTGVLVKPNDPVGLCNAVLDLKDNKTKVRRITANARKRIESQFNVKKKTLEHEDLYWKLIRRKLN